MSLVKSNISKTWGVSPLKMFLAPLLCHLCIHSSLESHIRGDSVYSGFPPPFPICADLLKGVLGACFLPFTWGLMAGLQGFANHGNSLFFLGAGCQQWKLLDISGPQLPLCDAVANYRQLLPCGHPAITDTPIIRTAAKSPAQTNYRCLTEINSCYYGHSLMRTLQCPL